MRLPPLLLIGLLAASSAGADAQVPHTAARLTEARLEPQSPAFAEPFELHLTVRVRPGVILYLPETLPAVELVESIGPLSLIEASAPGDSIDVRASYPMIAFRDGAVAFPELGLWVRVSVPGDSVATGVSRRAAELEAAVGEGAQRRTLRLGAVEIAPYPLPTEYGVEILARPAADVLGGEWSLWILLAVGLASAAGLGVASIMASRLWAGPGPALLARLRGCSPRQEAIREMERIRALGWHRNGHVEDFYAVSTDTLRRYAEQLDPEWQGSLTSTELLGRIESRWGRADVGSLGSAVESAERVKFSPYRPEPDTAEGDWAAMCDWIRRSPEA